MDNPKNYTGQESFVLKTRKQNYPIHQLTGSPIDGIVTPTEQLSAE